MSAPSITDKQQRETAGGAACLMLIRVDLPHLCAGLLSEEGIVTRTAPILAWAQGKPLEEVARWAVGKRGCVTVVWRKTS